MLTNSGFERCLHLKADTCCLVVNTGSKTIARVVIFTGDDRGTFFTGNSY
jgi:hypothetical protein